MYWTRAWEAGEERSGENCRIMQRVFFLGLGQVAACGIAKNDSLPYSAVPPFPRHLDVPPLKSSCVLFVGGLVVVILGWLSCLSNGLVQ